MILLSLASKQIWPQVRTVAQVKPARLVLLHSGDAAESRDPAQRLKRFFDNCGLVPKGGTRLELISDSDFSTIERQLDALQVKHQLDLNQCLLNFTGGNKLMATAAFRWAAKRGVKAFYLERRSQITWFEPRDGEVLTRAEPLDGHLTDEVDPVSLLRCQCEASEVERPGQRLTLNAAGKQVELAGFERLHLAGNCLRRFLQVEGQADRDEKEGDALEFNVAAVLLKLGVPSVQRSLRLKVRSADNVPTRKPHAEIDLLFNFDGRLWLVDCKDRRSSDELMDGLERELCPAMSGLRQEARLLLDRVRKELAISQTKVLKEDLIAVREGGGLLGQVVCIRKANLDEEVVQYANKNQIEVVSKTELGSRLQSLLYPNRRAAPDDLRSLVNVFGKK